jgi:hypothetical protein
MALAGVLQGEHESPQAVTLLLSTQLSEQLWAFAGHMPVQASDGSMQRPEHNRFPAGHSARHCFPSQPALPPSGTGHGSQLSPQVIGEVLSTQALSHKCWPLAHSQSPPLHVASSGQSWSEQQSNMHTGADMPALPDMPGAPAAGGTAPVPPLALPDMPALPELPAGPDAAAGGVASPGADIPPVGAVLGAAAMPPAPVLMEPDALADVPALAPAPPFVVGTAALSVPLAF